jgi:hypothetical protein
VGLVQDSRSTGSPVASKGWRGASSADRSFKREVHECPSSAVECAASSNPYDLLFEQGEQEIDSGYV